MNKKPPTEIFSSRQFPEWLAHQEISLALTTYQTGQLIFLGVNQSRQLSGYQRLYDRAMGLQATPARLYLSCKYQLWQLDNALTPGELYQGYDKLYVPRIGYTTGDLDVHDVAVNREGKVIFVSTLPNCLATVSDRLSCQPLWKPPFISRILNEDRCHLNGLAMVDGQPRYVTACSKSDLVDGWRDRRVDGGVVIDIASNEIVCTGLSMPHSPRWYKDKLWLHNSGRGELGYVDVNTGKFEAVAFCPGYLRGLAFWQDYAIVGLSKPRSEDKTFSGLPLDELLQQKDADPRCGLMVVDLNTGVIAHWVRFEGAITELYDVQVIPGVKRPMALGFQTEEIAQLITLETLEAVINNKLLKKVISFSLWGDNPKYTVGALKNADLAPKIYPGWICRFYINDTVPQEIIDNLSARDWVELIKIDEQQPWQGLFWRFYPAADPDVEVMISRDTDSRLNEREKAAVDEWLKSDEPFHLMRDHPRHNLPILGGMWGVKGNVLDMVKLIDDYLNNNSEIEFQYGIDQHFLATVIYPQVRDRCLVHDEIFEHKPFPLPRNNYEYVGQMFLADDSTSKETDEVLKQYLQQLSIPGEELPSQHLPHLSIPPSSDSPQKGFGKKTRKKKQRQKKKSALPQAPNQEQVAVNPAKTIFDRSRLLKQQGNLKEAEVCLREAIRLQPDYWPAHNNLGTLLQDRGDITEAKLCYQKAIQFNGNFAEALSNLASIWQLESDLEKAKTGFYRALQLKPDYVPAHFNLANIFKQQGRMAAAREHFQKVIALEPNYTEAYFNLGQIFEYQSKKESALRCYQQAQKIDPNATHISSYITMVELRLCNWDNYETKLQQLTQIVENYQADKSAHGLNPFILSTFPVSLPLHQAAASYQAQTIAQNIAQAKEPLKFKHSKSQPQKLRVGYISPDFRNHAVGRLIYQLFPYHDRTQFEVYAYSTVDVDDPITQAVRSGCDLFVDLSPLSSEIAAKRIYGDGIHILIDLAGYTIGNGASILALQPAPIQAQWLGYPDTMGAEFMPYYLGDRTLITPDIAHHYSEEIIYLPHAFVASPLAISEKVMTRAEFGLPEDGFVFCCFNSHYKINPEVFEVWMRILEKVPQSVLWLTSGEAKDNLRSEAKKRGCDPNRLIFADKIAYAEYLARYTLADLYLDTFIYNAGSTAAAVLWTGLPLLTCPGNTNASRMGASICRAAELEDNICNSVAEYEDRAVYLATHPQELTQMRQQLQKKLQSEATYPPLFQVENFVRSLESAFHQMWQKFLQQ